MNSTKNLCSLIMRAAKYLFVITVLLSFTFAEAQVNNHVPSDNRADPNFRRHSNLDGNNVRVTIHNFGVNGNEGSEPGQWGFEWPKNTNRDHIWFVSIWLGGEVVNDAGETLNIAEVSTSRSSPAGTVSQQSAGMALCGGD